MSNSPLIEYHILDVQLTENGLGCLVEERWFGSQDLWLGYSALHAVVTFDSVAHSFSVCWVVNPEQYALLLFDRHRCPLLMASLVTSEPFSGSALCCFGVMISLMASC